MESKKMVIVLSIALTISLVFLIFFIILSMHFQSLAIQARFNIYDKPSVFESKFHDLLQENTYLIIGTMARSLNPVSNSFNASYNILEINVKEISAQISDIYGTDNANQFISLEQTEINNFLAYTNATNNNDSTANSVFVNNMTAYEEANSDFWSNLTNGSLDKGTMIQLTADHINNIKEAIDDSNTKDYTSYFAKIHDSYIQIGMYADTITNAIIHQHSELF